MPTRRYVLQPRGLVAASAVPVPALAGCTSGSTPNYEAAAADVRRPVAPGGHLRELVRLATVLDLKNSFVNQPCEVPALRAQAQAQLSLSGAFSVDWARYLGQEASLRAA